MTRSRALKLAFGLGGALCSLPLVGCRQMSTTSSMSKQEEQSFKGGGPIPEDAKQEIAKRMQKSQQQIQQHTQNGGDKP